MYRCGYVYKPGTAEEERCLAVDRRFRMDEFNCATIKKRGCNPKDVWAFLEEVGITGPYNEPGKAPTATEIEGMKPFALEWNKKYIFGLGPTAPEYSKESQTYRKNNIWYCMCVDDWDSKFYVACMSFTDEEIKDFWKTSGLSWSSSLREFFNQHCKHHENHKM
jgi:hypothetical protein